MANDILGSELNISGLEDGIARIEKKMTALSANVTRNSNNIVKAFQEINANGVQSLISKLDELHKAMNKVSAPQQGQKSNPFAKNVDDVNKMITALDKSSTTWNNLQRNIYANEQQIQKLTESTRKFEAVQARIKAGGSGVVSDKEKVEYAKEIKTLGVLKQQVTSWRQKQQAIIQNNQAIQSQLNLQESLRRAEQDRTSLPNQRKIQELAQMNEYYRQQEIQMRKNYEAQAKLNQQKNQAYNTTTKGALEFSDNAKSINRQQKAIEYLTQARAKLNLTTSEGQRQAEQLTQRIRQHEDALKRATRTEQENANAIRRRNEALTRQRQLEQQKRISSSPQEAMAYSRTTKTINEQIMAIKRLKSARDNLNRGNFASEEAYRKKIQELNNEIKRQQTAVDRLTNKNKSLSNSHRSLMDTAGQLTRKLALLFSVSAIQGYFNKLVSIRGEFELQAKSLEVLLQNKDEANKLWNQTVQLAVKSPFTVKELVTYTKQLAAYRIESDKLYETNKMLADVSAGLGVDMQRLILAYGQVKAANFLRGTELRQFSEAGVNMLDELAKRFTTLEGRAVSVGDVFERISKRMVSFADVEAVFKTITSEGGTFYKMQEEQAETLRGMVSNLKDQIDLMLNDVGMSNEGFLKGLVSLTVTLVKNWRDIVPLINMVSGILITRFLQKGMVGILRMTKGVLPLLKLWKSALQGATTQAQALGTAMNGITKANAWIALIGLVVSLGYVIYDAATSASKLQEELGRIDTDLTQRLEESISGYISLAKTATDANKSMEEQKEAVAKLNSAYDDILPQYMLTHNYLQQLNGDYKEVTDAIRLYYETQAIEQKKAKIKDNYSEDINTDTVDLISDIKNQIKDSDLGQDLKDYLLASVSGAVHATLRDVEQGEIASDTKAITEAIFSAMAQGTGLSSDALIKALGGNVKKVSGDSFLELEEAILFKNSTIGKNISELATSFRDLNRELEGLEGLPDLENKIPLADKEGYEKTKEAYDLMNGLMNEYVNFVNKYVGKENVAWELLTPTINTENLEKLKALYPQLVPILQEFYTQLQRAANGQVQFAQSLPLIKATAIESFGAIVNNANTASNAIRDFGKVGITAGHDFSRIWADTDITNLTNPMQKALTQGNTAVKNFVEKANNDINKLQFNKVGTEIFNAMKQISQTQGVDLDVFAKIIPSANQSLDEYKRKVKEYLETLQEVQKTVNSTMITESFKKESLAGVNMDSVEELDATTKAVKMLADMIGVVFKSISGRSRRNNPAKDFANVLKKMRSEYEKFNEHFDKEDSAERVRKNWTKAFEEVKGKLKGLNLELKDFDFTTIEGMTEAFEKLKATAQGAKIASEIESNMAGLTDAQDLEVEEGKEKARDREIDQMFELYDVYKEIEKLGVNKKTAKSLFGIDATSLDELRTAIEDMKLRGAFTGKEGEEAYQKYIDKINEMENKAQEERLKKYIEYTKKSVDERARIELERLQKLAEIEETTRIKDGDTQETVELKQNVRKEATDKANKEAAQATQKYEWEEFQNSDIFLSVFQDAENASIQMMEHVLGKLRTFKNEWADMPLDSVKALTQKMNELEMSIIDAQNPFKALREVNKKMREELTTTVDSSGQTVSKTYTPEELEAEAIVASTKIETNNEEISQLSVINSLLEQGKQLTVDQVGTYVKLTKQVTVSQKGTKNAIAKRQEENKQLNTTVQKNQTVNTLEKEKRELLNKQATAIRQANKMANDLYDAFSEIWEVAGGDEVTKMFADMGMSIATSVLDTIALQMQLTGATTAAEMFGASMNSAMGIIGWIVLAIQIVAKVLSAVFAAHDAGLQEQIEELQDEIDTLAKELEKVEKALERAFTTEQIRDEMRKAKQNIEETIAAYDEMVELEKEKKDSDEDQIKSWQEEKEKLLKKEKELHEEMVESLGGTFDIREQAREWADAWVESFNETGSGLKGLKDNFKEFIKNILLEQVALKSGGKILDPLIKTINGALDDYTVTNYELADIEREGETAIALYDKAMQTLFGDGSPLNKWVSDAESSLSGLQEGIQGITEETAQIIEAYLNSIRFYVAQDNQNLTDLRNFFIGSEDNVNPMLAQLKIIATQTTAINSLLESLTAPHPTQSGRGLKVII